MNINEVTPKLIVLSEQLRGTAFPLKEDRYFIGRSESCPICIPDVTISSKHCSVTREEDGVYLLADNGSTNGTRVNGIKIQQQRLANGDILQFGGVELLYESQDKTATTNLSTQTGIDLRSPTLTGTVREMNNFSPFGSRSGMSASNRRTKLLMNIGIAAMVLITLAVLFLVLRGFMHAK